MEIRGELPVLLFVTEKAWLIWLEGHQGADKGVWLKFAKKGTGAKSISYDEALEGALCYGWIDGQVQRYNDAYYLQKFTPRRPRSIWSKRNVDKAARLITAGRMQPAGFAAIEQAKQNGQWELAYDSPRTMTVPPDLQEALDQSPKAQAFLTTLSRVNRYAFLWRIQTAKKPETRALRIRTCIEMLENGQTWH
jgi:uncharacterized protein YdeI (YjbR/CyaY-like superfamily)